MTNILDDYNECLSVNILQTHHVKYSILLKSLLYAMFCLSVVTLFWHLFAQKSPCNEMLFSSMMAAVWCFGFYATYIINS